MENATKMKTKTTKKAKKTAKNSGTPNSRTPIPGTLNLRHLILGYNYDLR